jgi:hypothetical protein
VVLMWRLGFARLLLPAFVPGSLYTSGWPGITSWSVNVFAAVWQRQQQAAS